MLLVPPVWYGTTKEQPWSAQSCDLAVCKKQTTDRAELRDDDTMETATTTATDARSAPCVTILHMPKVPK